MTTPDNSVANRVARVARTLADDDRDAALKALEPLIGQTRQTHPIELMPTADGAEVASKSGHGTRNPSVPSIARIFVRDRFVCLYCGRRTVPTQILRLISSAFPTEFPYHKNWRGDITPRVYWDISTSLDHIHPVSTGGSWNEPANLATACWRCNFQKSNRSIHSLGWPIRRDGTGWDGLTGEYPRLWEVLGRPDPAHHRIWLRAFGDATAGAEAPSPRTGRDTTKVGLRQTKKTKPKASKRASPWDQKSVLESIERSRGRSSAEVATRIIEWAAEHPLIEDGFGGGRSMGSFKTGVTDRTGNFVSCFDIWTYGKVEFLFKFMATQPPFDNEKLRIEFRDRLMKVPGLEIERELLNGRPNIPLDVFSPGAGLDLLFDAVDWWAKRFEVAGRLKQV